MPDQTVDRPTTLEPLALTVTMYTETISRVEATDLSRDDTDRLVSLAVGDDTSGVRLLGQLEDMRRVVRQAAVQLAALAMEER